MKIGFDAKRYFHNHTGLGNYSRTIVGGVQKDFPEIDCVLYDEKSMTRTFSLGRKAKADGCNLFHGLSNELPMDIVRAGIPSIVTLHDVAWRTFPKMYHWADRQIYDFKYGRACKNATMVLAISESTKRDCMRFYGIPEERIEVLYQPVGQNFYTPLSDKEIDEELSKIQTLPQEFILNVGSINARKNLLGLVQALEKIPAGQRPPLVVVGNGHEYRREVERYIAQHKMERDVIILGNVNDSKTLQALYSRCLAMAYPSFYEGFGLPVVEAALQRTPVLTSTVSSLPEAAGEGAILADPASVDSIHQGLSKLLDDRTFALELGQKAYNYAKTNFDIDAQTRKVVDLYKKVIG